MLNIRVGFERDRRAVAQAGHAAPITTVEWSPDGRRLATGSYDGSVLIWDGTPGAVVQMMFHSRLVNGVRWSHDGALLASCAADGTCRVWDPENGELELVLARHTDDVVDAAWSADDRLLVTVAQDGTGRLWNAESGELLDVVFAHRNHCMSVDWDAASGVIASCGEDSTIRLWDASGRMLADIAQPGDLESCRFAPSGGLLAGACDNGSVSLIRGTRSTGELAPLPAAAKCVSWSPDGRMIAVGTYDSSCTIFDVAAERAVARFHGDRLWPRSLDWNPTADRIAIGTFDAEPAIVEVDLAAAAAEKTAPERRAPRTRTVPPGPPTRGINAIAVAGDDGLLLGADDGLVWRWRPDEARPPEIVAGTPGGSLVNTLSWDRTGRLLAYGTFAGEVAIQDLDDGDPVFIDAGSPVNQVVWSPDRTRLAVATYHGVVHLVELDDGRAAIARTIEAHEAAVKGVAWLDESTFVTAATDRLAKVMSTSGETHCVLVGHGNLLNAVAVTTSGGAPRVATVSRDKTARVWDPHTGRCLRVLSGHDESAKAVAWAPDSSSILLTGSYDFDARVWDCEADEDDERFSLLLRGHRNGVGAVAWYGDQPVTAAWDTACLVWTLADGRPKKVSAIALADVSAAAREVEHVLG